MIGHDLRTSGCHGPHQIAGPSFAFDDRNAR
jgi:hypothetical protein